MLAISKLFLKYMHSRSVESIFAGLKPAVVGLMLAAVLLLCNEDNFGSPSTSLWQFSISIAIFIATWVGVKIVKISPITMLLYAGFAGLLLLYLTQDFLYSFVPLPKTISSVSGLSSLLLHVELHPRLHCNPHLMCVPVTFCLIYVSTSLCEYGSRFI